MQIEETVKDIDIAINLESASECSCDPDVGWVCERCFVISTLEKAKRLLTQRAPDVGWTCENGHFNPPQHYQPFCLYCKTPRG